MFFGHRCQKSRDNLQNIFLWYLKLLQKQSGGEAIMDLNEFAKCGNFHLAVFCVMTLFINFITNTDVMIFTVVFYTTIFNFRVFFKMTLWQTLKKICQLSSKHFAQFLCGYLYCSESIYDFSHCNKHKLLKLNHIFLNFLSDLLSDFLELFSKLYPVK